MNIGVIGCGTVGYATARAYMEYANKVFVYDSIKERSIHSLNEVVVRSDLIFVCLPEAALDEFFRQRLVEGSERNFVLKSTVRVGTTRRLANKYDLPNLVHSPEFLTARCAFTDACAPARNVIGYDLLNTCAERLIDLYTTRFPAVPVHCMMTRASEAVKLITNGFFSVKVAYFNEVYRMCRRWEMPWQDVLNAVLADGRIAHSHTSVPGPDGKYGFGGTCLPKDLEHLIAGIDDAGETAEVCKAALARNRGDRERGHE